MNSYCIKVKRKGFNYYTGPMEQYFENTAVQYGYHLTKRIEQADLWCVTFLGSPGGSKWVTFISDAFNNITYDELDELARRIGECFKSTSVVETADRELMEATRLSKAFFSLESDFNLTDEFIRKYGEPELWLFSKEHSAFDEPPAVTDGETVFRELQYDALCESGKPFNLCVMNIGGPSKGLTVNCYFEHSDDAEIESAFLSFPGYKDNLNRILLELERVVENGRTIFRASLPELEIQAGFNEYSAKVRGKRRTELEYKCSLWLSFVPKGILPDLMGLKIEVIPNEYPANKLVF